ncbi:MAG: type VII secretion protein EccCb, partial [Actinomycetota bacterium]
PSGSAGDAAAGRRAESAAASTPTAAAITDRWVDEGSPRLIGGLSDHGTAILDLAAHGPHVAVIGGRGSGKTEALTSMVVALAASRRPERVHFVLWGESFSPLQRLPHVANTISRVDEATLGSFLDGLDRELVRRERRRAAHLGDSATSSPSDFPGDAAAAGSLRGAATAPTDTPTASAAADEQPEPTLVVVVDDIDRIDRVVPTAGDDLLRLLRRARNVGVHVLFSTSRHQGGTLNDLVDLAGSRLVLRVGSGPDSTDLIGSDAASRLERTLPGRGYLVAGRHDPVEVQGGVVTVGAPRPTGRLELHDFMIGAGRTGFASNAVGPPELGSLLSAIGAAGATSQHAPDLLSPTAESANVLDSPGLLDLLGVGGIGGLGDSVDRWIDTDGDPLLRLPIGVDPDLRPVVLDLKESALNGMGPHGLLVGATGSGKSELLRTLVGGLALTHSPEVLSFVLVDFKGGASFATLGKLPHVAGVVTNLADDLALVDRILAALGGEQRRRQELLAASGNLPNVQEYRAARRAGKLPPELADQPLPDLVLVVDEFAELLDQEPDFIDFFLTIGRVGRSLGIHMLLASQRLEEGKLRGLDTYLSYRLGLRTFSAAESRIVLGSPDAYSLPQAPGGGYLKVGSSTFDRFQASYVSGPIPPDERAEDDDPDRTVLDAIVDHLADAAPKVHQIWLPPLADQHPLDDVFGAGFVNDERRGFAAARWPRTGSLGVPIGTIDEPGLQRQVPLVLDFAGAHGNLAIAGAPQTGKSTALRTMTLGLGVTHTPTEVQVYGVDFGGGTLASLDALPHVGTVATRLEPDRVRRLLAHVEATLEQREALFGRLDVDSMATVRRHRLRRGAGASTSVPVAGDGDTASTSTASPSERSELDEWIDRGDLADVFLVIDGWAAFRERFEALEPVIADLASRGLGYGVHIVVTLNRWMEMRANVLDAIGGRLELRLNSALDSMIDRKRAAVIRVDQPGPALHPSGLLSHVAIPRLDGRSSQEQLAGATKVAVDHIAERWSGPVAAPIRLLPDLVHLDELDTEEDGDVADGNGAAAGAVEPGVAVGLAEDTMGPWRLDLTVGDPHFFVYGDGESGKTTLLETFLHGLASTTTPEQAQIAVVDYRRTLLERIPESHLAHYAAAEPAAVDVIAQIGEQVTARLPGSDVTASQLRERSWWSGPDWYVVVDDYDLIVTPSGNPLSPLLPLLAQGRDVGLHVIVARRVAGAAKMMYEPITARLREVSPAGIVLSGDREEGPLLGQVRASEQPPGRGVVVT